jgi:mono/diheme cytochrome c family protein
LKKAFKIIAASAAFAVIAAAGSGAAAIWLGERKLARVIDIRVVPVPFVKDAAAVRHGKYLYESRGCGECHGPDGHGIVFLDERGGLYAKAPNISRGPGSVTRDYGEGDWVRAIRHGVDPKGRALLAMPSEDYNRLNDADFAALVAYVRQLPPVAGDGAAIRLPLLVKALYGAGLVKDAAEKIDHRRPPSPAIPAAPSAEHGAYVAAMCTGCHGESLAGGRIPGAPPGWPPAADLTGRSGHAMARYDTPDKFIAMMRSGKRPDGSDVSEAMPFGSLRNINDIDLQAMYAYLETLRR